MGRHATGWKIRLPKRSKTYTVYWWDIEEQRQHEYSTKQTDPEAATKVAPKIYAKHVGSTAPKSRGVKPTPSLKLDDVAVDWIEAMRGQIGDGTLASYSGSFDSFLVPSFPLLSDLFDDAKKADYVSVRLKQVQGKTVRKELSALRGLASWAHTQGLIDKLPSIPSIPKKALGTKHTKKRRSKAIPLTPEEVEAFLAALPERAPKLGVVRARFVLSYEMALRPSLVDRLSCPDHWTPKSRYLDLDGASMKGREESLKRLTKRAIEALEASYRKPGLLYGHHDYRVVVRAAAAASLTPDKAAKFTPAHLRSAGITHYCRAGASLPAAQRFADHRLASTTDKYMRATEKDNEDELRRQGRL